MSTIKEKLSSIYSQDNPVSVLRLLRELIDAMDETATQADIAEVKASLATLTDDLSAEVTARIAGDEALTETMRDLTGQLKLRCTALEKALDTETYERKKADNDLVTGITRLADYCDQLQNDFNVLSSKKTIADTATAGHNPVKVGFEATNGTRANRVSVHKTLDGDGGWYVDVGDEGVRIGHDDDTRPLLRILHFNASKFKGVTFDGTTTGLLAIDYEGMTGRYLGATHEGNAGFIAGFTDTSEDGPMLYMGTTFREAIQNNEEGACFSSHMAYNCAVFDFCEKYLEGGTLKEATLKLSIGRNLVADRTGTWIRIPVGNVQIENDLIAAKLSTPSLEKTGTIRLTGNIQIGTYAFRGTPLYDGLGNIASCPGTLTLTFTAPMSASLDATFEMTGIDTMPGHVVGTCYDWDGNTGFVTVANKPGSPQTKMSVTPVGGKSYAFSANIVPTP